jgi:hypothetical protein
MVQILVPDALSGRLTSCCCSDNAATSACSKGVRRYGSLIGLDVAAKDIAEFDSLKTFWRRG